MSLLKVNEVQNYNGSSLTLTASTVSTSAQLNTGGNISVTGSINVSDDSTTRSNLGLGTMATQSANAVAITGGTINTVQPATGQSLTIKDEDGNTAITVGTDNTATGYLSLNFGSYHGGNGTLTGSTLNDYEEGTFQPSIDAGYTVNPGFTTRIGNYIKIGNVVHCHIRIDLDGTGTASSADVEIGGLPFATLSSNTVRNTNFGGHFSAYVSGLTANAYYFVSTLNSDNSLRIYHFTSSSIDGLIGTELGTNAIITVDLTYFIATFA